MEMCLCGQVLQTLEESAKHTMECYYAQRNAQRKIDHYDKQFCTKTISGRHHWVTTFAGLLQTEGDFKIIRCRYCNIVNDLPTKGGEEHGRQITTQGNQKEEER